MLSAVKSSNTLLRNFNDTDLDCVTFGKRTLFVLFSSGLKIGIAGFWSITSIHFNNIRQKHHAIIHCRIFPINVVIATPQAMFASLVTM